MCTNCNAQYHVNRKYIRAKPAGHQVGKYHEPFACLTPILLSVYVNENLGVMSIGFMLPNRDDAVIWRGPRKNGLIKQFLTDVDWGELDFLIIDSTCIPIDLNIRLTSCLALP